MITSKRNPLVRKLRSLLKKTGREEHSSLLLEGSHLLEEALKTKFWPTEVIATPEWCEEHEEVLKKIASRSLLTLVTANVLEASLSTVTPDGVAAIFPMPGLPKPGKALKHILALDRIQDPPLAQFFICLLNGLDIHLLQVLKCLFQNSILQLMIITK